MKAQHTPGPWTIKNNADQILIICPSMPLITTVNAAYKLPIGLPEANAKLIAASPDILEALQEILTTMQRTDIKSIEDAVHIIGKIGNRAISAIKKATE